MIVYHGSICEIVKPDIKHSKRYLDFGCGFYVTTYKNQVERWAIRKSLRSGKGTPTVNIYQLPESYSEYNVLTFRDPEDDEAWLDFVCDCRDGKEDYKKYDIIICGVADDDVFKSVEMYHRGVWDKNRTLKELKYYKKNNQLAIINQEVLDKLLRLQRSYMLEV